MIVCGHFVDGAEKFTPSVLDDETKPEWYLRQMLGTANFRAGPDVGVHDRKSLLPDRTSPVSRSAAQSPTRRSPSGCVRYARPTTCPTRPAHCCVNTCSPCAPSANWRCRTAVSPPPAMTHRKRPPRTSFGTLNGSRLCHRAARSARRRGLATALRAHRNSTPGRMTLKPAALTKHGRARAHPDPVRRVQAPRSPRRTWPRSAGV